MVGLSRCNGGYQSLACNRLSRSGCLLFWGPSGHFCTAILGMENSCLLWLLRSPLGGAAAALWLADVSPFSIKQEEVNNFIHDSAINENWHGNERFCFDICTPFFLMNNSCHCQRLEKNASSVAVGLGHGGTFRSTSNQMAKCRSLG